MLLSPPFFSNFFGALGVYTNLRKHYCWRVGLSISYPCVNGFGELSVPRSGVCAYVLFSKRLDGFQQGFSQPRFMTGLVSLSVDDVEFLSDRYFNSLHYRQ